MAGRITMASDGTGSILHRGLGVGHHDSVAEDDVEALPHNRFLTSGIWRVRGVDGSAIRKTLSAPSQRQTSGAVTAWDAHWAARAESKRHWNYWRREVLAYQEGLVD